MMKLQGIDHIVLKTDQRDAMIAFYCDILACEVVKQVPSIGLTHLKAGSQMIDLVAVDSLDTSGDKNMDHFCLLVADFDQQEIVDYLTQQNVAILDQGVRFGAQGDGYSIYINDPQGNEVELKQSLV